MSTGSVIKDIACRSCGTNHSVALDEYPCPECGGILSPQYDLSSVSVERADIERRRGSMWRYRELLPIREQRNIISMGEGETPLIDCPRLADRLGVKRVLIKDEGQNPTNTFKDRGLAAAISAAVERDETTVALPSAGNAGQAASAYAARAGLDCHVYLNHQAGAVQKQLVRAHGAELHLVDGRITEAAAAFASDREESGWASVSSFHTPFRHDGKKTMGYEVYEQLGWDTPDEIVYPTGGGVGLVGFWRAYRDLQSLGWLDAEPPRLVVAQAEGVAPVVEAIQNGWEQHEPWDCPHSIAKGLEIPDPGASPWIIEAVNRTGGDGVAVSDSNGLDAAITAAQQAGVEMCVPSAVALAGAFARAADGTYDGDETIVVVNTGAGCKSAGRLGPHARS